jgi:iron transport multicopper oxidase
MEISVTRGVPIRVRCINAAALSMYRISVDGMPLKVIEIDGNPVTPQDFSQVTLDAAQRVSFILDWSRLAPSMTSLTRIIFRVHAVPTMYRQYDFTDANALGLYGSSTNTKFFTQWLGHFAFTGETTTPYYAATYYAASEGPTNVYPKPLETNLLQMKPLFPSPLPAKDLWFGYNITFQKTADGVLRAYINGQTYVAPSVPNRPALFDYMSAAGGALQEEATYAKNSQIFGDAMNPFVLPFNRTIDVLIRNNDGGPHPIHMHGHNFWVVSTSQYNNASSIKRDVVSIPALGWAIIRFVSDNPGIWLLHCHIDWHMANGFISAMIEAPSKLKNTISSVPADHKAACPDYFSGTLLTTFFLFYNN